jgi:PTS system N-acetylgalactosamine-specific IIA component
MSVSLKNGMGQDEFADEVRNLLKVVKADDELIVFADIIGGSPLTTTADVASELGILGNTRMIGGMNLPLVLTTLVEDEGVNDEIIENAREQIKEFRIEASVDDDEI